MKLKLIREKIGYFYRCECGGKVYLNEDDIEYYVNELEGEVRCYHCGCFFNIVMTVLDMIIEINYKEEKIANLLKKT